MKGHGQAAERPEGQAPRRVVLADDKPDIRSAMRLLIEEEAGVLVEAEAVDAPSLLGVLGQGVTTGAAGAADPRQHDGWVLLLDWELPGMPPEELLRRVRGLAPRIRVVALSSRPESEAVALTAGADGFVSKGQPPECLLESLHPRALGRERLGDEVRVPLGEQPSDAGQNRKEDQ